MAPKIKISKSGWWTHFEKGPRGFYIVTLRTAAGELYDRVACDDYRGALAYLRAFNAIARNAR